MATTPSVVALGDSLLFNASDIFIWQKLHFKGTLPSDQEQELSAQFQGPRGGSLAFPLYLDLLSIVGDLRCIKDPVITNLSRNVIVGNPKVLYEGLLVATCLRQAARAQVHITVSIRPPDQRKRLTSPPHVSLSSLFSLSDGSPPIQVVRLISQKFVFHRDR